MPTSQFGKLLRELRKREGLNQSQLATHLHVDRSTVSRIETGSKKPPLDSAFYERLRVVPGVSEADIKRFQEAAQVNNFTEAMLNPQVHSSIGVRRLGILGKPNTQNRKAKDPEIVDEEIVGAMIDHVQQILKAHQETTNKIRKRLETRVAEVKWGNPARSLIQVRREGLLGEPNRRYLARIDAAKAADDLAVMLANMLKNHARLGVSIRQGEEVLLYGALLSAFNSEVLAQAFAEVMTMDAEIALREIVQPSKYATEASGTAVEEAPDILTESLHTDVKIHEIVNPEPEPVRIHYPHTMPEHAPELVDEGKWEQTPKKGVVFQSSDAKLLFDALGKPDHEYRLAAEKAMRGFSEDVKRAKVTSLNKAASKYHISVKTLSEWVAKGLIPYEYRDKNAVYLAEEIAQEVARDNQEAKEMGMQTARLLRERREKYFPSPSKK
jgi:DNA-binding XRE family transcriptional regulator